MTDPKSSDESMDATDAGDVFQPDATVTPEPQMVDIAHRAYTLYISNGRQRGRFKESWFQAEAELRNERRKDSLRQQGDW
jgi:hypothetical protein